MPEANRYDVIIVGGGPAGSTAGYILSNAGIKTLIIDKSIFPRQKLCAGLLTFKTVNLLERVFNESAESLKDKGIINYESYRYEVFGKQSTIADRNIKYPFRFIDRDSYDHNLLKKARDAGAEIIEGDGVARLDMLKSRVITTSGQSYSADIIIGADGVNSRIRRSFLVDLFGRGDWRENLAAAHEVFISRDTVRKEINHPLLFFDYVAWGYSWVFPNRDKLKIGMCALKKYNSGDILTVFRSFLSSLDLFDDREVNISSYVLPYGSYLPNPTFKNILLVGDAAGFADALFGEGIFFAHRSAELAALAVIEAFKSNSPPDQVGKHYQQLLEKFIYPELIYSKKIRDAMFKYLRKFRWYPLKILMGLFGNMPIETVQGLWSYRWMQKVEEK